MRRHERSAFGHWLGIALLAGALFGVVEEVAFLLSHTPLPTRALVALFISYLAGGLVLGILAKAVSFLSERIALALVVIAFPGLYTFVFLNDLALSGLSSLGRGAGNICFLAAALTLWIALSLGLSRRPGGGSPSSLAAFAAVVGVPSLILVITATRFIWSRGDAASGSEALLYEIVLLVAWGTGYPLARLCRGRLRPPAGGAGPCLVFLSAVAVAGAVVSPRLDSGRALAPAGSPAEVSPAERGVQPNIVFLSLDTTRRDRLSLYGNRTATSPNLDALALEGLVFRNLISTAPWTAPSHASLFTGLYSSEHLVVHEEARPPFCRPLAGRFRTLAELLHEEGYSTGGFVANSGFLNRSLGFAQGFELYDDRMTLNFAQLPLRAASRLPGSRRHLLFRELGVNKVCLASEVNRRALAWLDSRSERPFFLFLNYMEPHGVNYLPFARAHRLAAKEIKSGGSLERERDRVIRSRGRLSPSMYRELLDWYDLEVLFMDQAVGELMGALRRRGLFEETLIVAWSDHGELMGEHGSFGHQSELCEELLRVPLIIKLPRGWARDSGVAGGEAVNDYLQSTDLFHFLLALAGAADPLPETRRGRMVRALETAGGEESGENDPEDAGEFVVAELYRSPILARQYPERYDRDLEAVYARVGGPECWKLVRSTRGERELYRIEMDVREERDLASSEGEVIRELGATLDSWRDGLRREDSPGAERERGLGLERQLRSLGYLH